MQGLYKATVLADNPSLYWRLGSAGLDDQTANNRDGTAEAGVTVGDSAGAIVGDTDGATDLDGTTAEYITAATYDPFITNSTRTFEGWARHDTNTATAAVFGSNGNPTALSMDIPSGTQNVRFFPRDSTATTWTSAWPGNAVWVHFALVFDESLTTNNVELFIDGVSKGLASNADKYAAASTMLRVGCYDDPTVREPWDGKIDEFAVYEYALTAAQIRQHYLIGSGRAFGGAFAAPGMAWR